MNDYQRRERKIRRVSRRQSKYWSQAAERPGERKIKVGDVMWQLGADHY